MAFKNSRWDILKDDFKCFDDIWLGAQELFEQAGTVLASNQQNHIPYNLLRTNTGFRIDVAVAGFTRDDISVQYDKKLKQLQVSGQKSPDEKVEYITKKIATRSFTYKWTVDDSNYKIGPIVLRDGILSIDINKHVDEDEKPSTVKFDIS